MQVHVPVEGDVAHRVPVPVDVDVVVVPVKPAPKVIADGDSEAQGDARDQARADDVAPWVPPVRGDRPPPPPVDDGRVVDRDVDDLGVRRLDHDDLRLDQHLLAVIRAQVARLVGTAPELLDRVHDPVLLREHRITQPLGPLEALAHHLQDLREGSQGLHAGVPGLVLQGTPQGPTGEAGVRFDPAGRLDDLQGIGRGHQDLGQEGVRVQGHGREDAVQLLLRQGPSLLSPGHWHQAHQDRQRHSHESLPQGVHDHVLPVRPRTLPRRAPARTVAGLSPGENERRLNGSAPPGGPLRPGRPSAGRARGGGLDCRQAASPTRIPELK